MLRQSIPAWLVRHATAIVLVLAALGSLRIVSTYRIFSHVVDEPCHIACGMEWLDRGTYRIWAEQPPLARVATALGPYLAGRRLQDLPSADQQGVAILTTGEHYERNLMLARLGILPFFWIALLVVYLWARRIGGAATGLWAVFFFTFLPAILAHSGLATTDMALTALLGLAFLSALWWAEHPSLLRSIMFGAATGLAVLAKFSTIAFLPVSLAVALLVYLGINRPKLGDLAHLVQRRVIPLCLAGVTGFLVIWAGYRFSVGTVHKLSFPVPAPELLSGISQVYGHNQIGHRTYFLGHISQSGWWYYYPIMLVFKTPLAFLLLTLAGIASFFPIRGVASYWLPLAFSAGILLFSLASRINIGIRHVLPVYIGFSILAAQGALWLADLSRAQRWAGAVLAALVVWFAAASMLSHPDYLSYFNLLAGSRPENIVVDSDLDWGQDAKRLAKRLRELRATHVSFSPFSSGWLAAGLPPVRKSNPEKPDPGWNAVSVSNWKLNRLWLLDKHPDAALWPDRAVPAERVGNTILLYWFPDTVQ